MHSTHLLPFATPDSMAVASLLLTMIWAELELACGLDL